eukprot:gene8487-9393_t
MSGFPRLAVDELISNCMKIKEPNDVMRLSSILNSDLCTLLWKIVTEALKKESFVNINLQTLPLPESQIGADLADSDDSYETSESETSGDSSDSDHFTNLKYRYKSRLPSSSSDDSNKTTQT